MQAKTTCADHTRRQLADAYRYPLLGDAECFFGFASRLGAENAPFAPTADELADLLQAGVSPDHVWRTVLCRFLARSTHVPLLQIYQADETHDARFRAAIAECTRPVAMVCDALDRLASDWSSVRALSRGLLQLALDLRGFRRVNVKVFLRRDQFEDPALFDFPDASKLRTSAVDLDWEHDELYGLLFKWIRTEIPADAWERQLARVVPESGDGDMRAHRAAFERIAGERMGYEGRGLTYTWVPRHLADTSGHVSPRSFMVAMGKAAAATDRRTRGPVDYRGLYEGVRAASETRVAELEEDHPWIREVLRDLEGLVVPCPERAFTDRWRNRGTASRIRALAPRDLPVDPISLESRTAATQERALLDAVMTLRIAELRKATGRINVPDVYRVAAKIGRRGGVPPLKRPK